MKLQLPNQGLLDEDGVPSEPIEFQTRSNGDLDDIADHDDVDEDHQGRSSSPMNERELDFSMKKEAPASSNEERTGD